MDAQVTLKILHPDHLRGGDFQTNRLRSAIREEKWIERYPPFIHHASPQNLIEDAEAIRQYAQDILNRYGNAMTRDVEIQLIPTIPDEDTNRFNGAHGGWVPCTTPNDVIQLLWASTDKAAAQKVLTHELGHHLRSFCTPEICQRYVATYGLLQEICAEALVLAEYGKNGLHHNRPLTPVSFYLTEIIEKEITGQPLDNYLQGIQAGLPGTSDIYPPATALLLQLQMTPQQLFSIPVEQFAERILPLTKKFNI